MVLKDLKEHFGGPKFWQEITEFLPGKKSNEVRRKFLQLTEQGLKKGKWTSDEDLKIKVGVKVFGLHYNKIAQLFKTEG